MDRRKTWTLFSIAILVGGVLRTALLASFAYAAALCIHHNETVERCDRYNPVGQDYSDANEVASSVFDAFYMLLALAAILKWRRFSSENFLHELPHTPLFWALLVVGGLSCVMAFFVRLVSNKSPLLDVSQALEIGVYIVVTPAVQYLDVPLLREDASSVDKTRRFRQLTTGAWFAFLLGTQLRLVTILAYDAMSTARVLRVTPVGSTNEFDAILLVMAVALRSGMLSVFYNKLFEWRAAHVMRPVCSRTIGRSAESTSIHRGERADFGSCRNSRDERLDESWRSRVSISLSSPLKKDQDGGGEFTARGPTSRSYSVPGDVTDGASERQPLLSSTATHATVTGALLYSS